MKKLAKTTRPIVKAPVKAGVYFKPQKVNDINCKVCGELLLRVYPWCLIVGRQGGEGIPLGCARCENKKLKQVLKPLR